jgi:hypothetical protein
MAVIKQLAYFSQACKSFNEDELYELVEKSREHNKPKGITGILVYNAGYFLQLLEGDPTVVDDLYRTIIADKRHQKVTTIFEQQSVERMFRQDWYMAYKNMNEFDHAIKTDVDDLMTSLAHKGQLDSADDLMQVIRLMRQDL